MSKSTSTVLTAKSAEYCCKALVTWISGELTLIDKAYAARIDKGGGQWSNPIVKVLEADFTLEMIDTILIKGTAVLLYPLTTNLSVGNGKLHALSIFDYFQLLLYGGVFP